MEAVSALSSRIKLKVFLSLFFLVSVHCLCIIIFFLGLVSDQKRRRDGSGDGNGVVASVEGIDVTLGQAHAHQDVFVGHSLQRKALILVLIFIVIGNLIFIRVGVIVGVGVW